MSDELTPEELKVLPDKLKEGMEAYVQFQGADRKLDNESIDYAHGCAFFYQGHAFRSFPMACKLLAKRTLAGRSLATLADSTLALIERGADVDATWLRNQVRLRREKLENDEIQQDEASFI